MFSRRTLRETTVQLLYARRLGTEDPNALWSLIFERDLKSWDKARLKLLGHLQQGRQARLKKLQNLVHEATPAIAIADPDAKLARQVEKHLLAEEAWLLKLETLPHLAKADTGAWQTDLQILFAESEKLPRGRQPLQSALHAFPPLQAEQIETQLKALNEFDQRARRLFSPKLHPDFPELSHLRKSQEEREALKNAATELADQVSAAQSELDPLISQVAENFSITRFSQVDLDIIRLAAWEIFHQKDLPAAVSIDEAIDIARRFGTTQSASFVNGILDKLAKSENPALGT